MEREFKYYRDSFGQLPVKVKHMDLFFDVYEKHTDATNAIHVTSLQPIESLQLNADDLDIHEVSIEGYKTSFDYDKKNKHLNITLDKEIPKDTDFIINTKSTFHPTSNVLEGMYYDETPKGCPCTMITQCQQWGFQRIVPCFDDMSAKCTYKTTIQGDKQYTNIISNGDPKKVMEDIGNNRVQAVYDNTITPMATYLFFMGLGTYATFTKNFRYPSGKSFSLELLVPPGSDRNVANQALDILHDAVLWIHLFTGPDTYKNQKVAKEVWRLMKEEKYAEAQTLAKDVKWGYQYTGKVYREIGMQNSNYGGMENVGNTTITTNRIMPYPYMSDRGFIYMMRVKAHEYYHNLNGSEVTGATPFEFWLNEAVTVFIEQRYTDFMHGEEFQRLDEIHTIADPQDGILALDNSPAANAIEPEGFNSPDELVDSITYIKGPEVVRMVETIIGKETFVKALDLYHTRFKHSNARSDQWFECMKEVSGIDLTDFMNAWIKTKGHPVLHATVKDNKLHLEQLGKDIVFPYPLVYAIFDKEGKQLKEETLFVQEKTHEIELPEEYGFISLNRSLAAFFEVEYTQSDEELYLQARHDTDLYCKNLALNKLFANERLRLLKNTEGELDNTLVELYGELFFNQDLQELVGVDHIAVLDYVNDKTYLHKYQDLHDVREKMFKTIATKYESKLLDVYQSLSAKEYYGTIVEKRVASIKDRSVKNTCLAILSRLDTKETQDMTRKQFLSSVNASDKLLAFRLFLKSSASDRLQIMTDYEKEAKTNLVTWEAFLVGVAGNEADDALDFIKTVEESPAFRVDQSNDQRALYSVYASNKRKSLLTKDGRKYLKHIAIKLSPINQYNTLRSLGTLDCLNYLDADVQVEVVQIMLDIKEALKDHDVPMVTSYLDRTLKGSPKAKEAYEKEKGKIKK